MAKNDIAIKERYITEDILNDLKEKMVFVGGPRQVGKTTMSLYIADNYYTINTSGLAAYD
jgi:predicted AAA+ superfamily ATPase